MQRTRSAHCVIDRISRPTSSSFIFRLAPTLITHSPQRQASSFSHSPPYLHTPSKAGILFPSYPRRTTTTKHTLTPLLQSRTMSSDDAYMSFLDKANADLNNARAERAQRQSIARTEAIDIDVRVPAPLTSVDAYYVSETDEPFEPVTLKWEKAAKGLWPDPTNLSNLISPTTDLSSSISTLSPSAFDPHNQYATVLRAVRAAAVQAPSEEAGGGPHQEGVDVKVYRVEVGASRVEYWLLALNIEESLLVGLRVKAVES